MALSDECAVGRREDIVIVCSVERLGLPVSLAVTSAVIVKDGFGRHADTNPDRVRCRRLCAAPWRGFAPRRTGVLTHTCPKGNAASVTGQDHTGNRQEPNLRRSPVSLEDSCCNCQHKQGDKVDRALQGERRMPPAVCGE